MTGRTFPRWWTDGERVIEDDWSETAVVRLFGEWVAWSVDGDIVASGLKPATCSICEGPIAPDASYPLCSGCERTSRVHAQIDHTYAEYLADCGLTRPSGRLGNPRVVGWSTGG